MSKSRLTMQMVGWIRELGRRFCQSLKASATPYSVCGFASRKSDRPGPEDIAAIVSLIERLERAEQDGISIPQLPTQP